MAQKRMFDKRVVETDKFMDLPMSAKALYFMAGISADDKGFFQPKKLQKVHGFSDDDFKILIAKQYLIVFDTGVMVITDWNKNNWLDTRRVQETEYIDELKLLTLINEKYELLDCAKRMLSENRIEENRIEQNSIEENNKKEIHKEKNNFTKPTIEELKEFTKEHNLKIDEERFIDYYEAKGWMIGKSKMKDWKAAARNWNRNQKQTKEGTREKLERILKDD